MKQHGKQRSFEDLHKNHTVEAIRAALPITGRYLRSPEAAAYIGVTVDTVRDWAGRRDGF